LSRHQLAIRKPAVAVFTLDDYAGASIELEVERKNREEAWSEFREATRNAEKAVDDAEGIFSKHGRPWPPRSSNGMRGYAPRSMRVLGFIALERHRSLILHQSARPAVRVSLK
jgi:hypothetical protein